MRSNFLAFRVVLAVLLLAPAMVTLAATQLSREQGDSLARKIDEINKNAATQPVRQKRTPMTETEVNSYLAFNVKDKIPRGLANPEIRIGGDGQLAGRVFVDIDEFKRSRSSGGIMDPLSYISGQVPLTARGVLRARERQRSVPTDFRRNPWRALAETDRAGARRFFFAHAGNSRRHRSRRAV